MTELSWMVPHVSSTQPQPSVQHFNQGTNYKSIKTTSQSKLQVIQSYKPLQVTHNFQTFQTENNNEISHLTAYLAAAKTQNRRIDWAIFDNNDIFDTVVNIFS